MTLPPETGAHAMGGPSSDATTPGRTSLGELFSEVSKDLSTLVRQEVELAKAEATQSAKRAGRGVGLFGGAAVAGHFVLLFLSVALWWGLGNVMDRAWSAVIVAVIWAIIAAVLALRGKREVQKVKGLPRTTATAKQIPDALKGHEGATR